MSASSGGRMSSTTALSRGTERLMCFGMRLTGPAVRRATLGGGFARRLARISVWFHRSILCAVPRRFATVSFIAARRPNVSSVSGIISVSTEDEEAKDGAGAGAKAAAPEAEAAALLLATASPRGSA